MEYKTEQFEAFGGHDIDLECKANHLGVLNHGNIW